MWLENINDMHLPRRYPLPNKRQLEERKIKKDVTEHSEVSAIEKISCCLQGNILK